MDEEEQFANHVQNHFANCRIPLCIRSRIDEGEDGKRRERSRYRGIFNFSAGDYIRHFPGATRRDVAM